MKVLYGVPFGWRYNPLPFDILTVQQKKHRNRLAKRNLENRHRLFLPIWKNEILFRSQIYSKHVSWIGLQAYGCGLLPRPTCLVASLLAFGLVFIKIRPFGPKENFEHHVNISLEPFPSSSHPLLF